MRTRRRNRKRRPTSRGPELIFHAAAAVEHPRPSRLRARTIPADEAEFNLRTAGPPGRAAAQFACFATGREMNSWTLAGLR